jgi:pimeloyl-ACP methyl ester carboxylesterase
MRTVVFIHGLGLHATSWRPWVARFAAAGFAASAPLWPGEAPTVEQAREDPGLIAGHGLASAVGHYRRLLAGLPRAPFVVGHSVGGLIAARVLARNLAVAGVCLDADPAAPGLPEPLPSFRALLPALREPSHAGRAFSLTAPDFAAGYGAGLARAESDRLYARWSVPAPARPFFETIEPGPAPGRPLLIVGAAGPGGPVAAGTTVHSVRGHGHLLTVDEGWPEVAELCLAWLNGC